MKRLIPFQEIVRRYVGALDNIYIVLLYIVVVIRLMKCATQVLHYFRIGK